MGLREVVKVAKQWKKGRSKTARTAVRTIVGAMAAPEGPTDTLMKLFWKSVGHWVAQVRKIRKKIVTVKSFCLVSSRTCYIWLSVRNCVLACH